MKQIYKMLSFYSTSLKDIYCLFRVVIHAIHSVNEAVWNISFRRLLQQRPWEQEGSKAEDLAGSHRLDPPSSRNRLQVRLHFHRHGLDESNNRAQGDRFSNIRGKEHNLWVQPRHVAEDQWGGQISTTISSVWIKRWRLLWGTNSIFTHKWPDLQGSAPASRECQSRFYKFKSLKLFFLLINLFFRSVHAFSASSWFHSFERKNRQGFTFLENGNKLDTGTDFRWKTAEQDCKLLLTIVNYCKQLSTRE